MRKILILILLSIALVANAQIDHFNFMGIPLDGKISSFNRELKKKGFSLEPYVGKEFDGTYIYKGIFAGNLAQVFVFYDVKTKIVYQACVVIERNSKYLVIDSYKDMCNKLEEKYINDEGVAYMRKLNREKGEQMKENGVNPFEWKLITNEDGYEATTFIIPSLKTGRFKGLIKVFVCESNIERPSSNKYKLYIRYTDWANDKSNQDNIMDDF